MFTPMKRKMPLRDSLKSLWLGTAALMIAVLLCQGQACRGQGREAVESLVKIFTTWNGSDRTAYSEAACYIDYKLMAERVLGSEYWHNLPASDKLEFTEAFRHLIEKRYYVRWHRIFRKGVITYLDEDRHNGDVFITTRLTNGDSTDNVIWRLARNDGAEKVVSLQVGEKDLIARARLRFQKKLAKGGFKPFLVWLKDESKAGQGQETAQSKQGEEASAEL